MASRLQALISTGRDRVGGLLLLGTLALGVHGVVEWVDRAHRLADAEQRGLLLAARGAALAAVAVALAVAWRRRSRLLRGESGSVGFALRGLAAGPLLGWLAGSAAHVAFGGDKTSVASAFWSALIAFVALFHLYALLAPERFYSPRRHWLDALAWNLLLTLVLAEVAVSLWAWRHPSPFLWDESSVVASLEARRLPPGAFFLGTRANRGGYHDEEFHPPRGDDEQVVAVLADSFGLGVVPHAHHFTTVAERRLAELLPDRRVALHNFGVAGIGLPEYAWLLEHEVPETSPELVLLCVFVGNDINSYTRRRGSYYDFQRFTLYELARRLLGVTRAARGGALDSHLLGVEQAPPIPEPGREEPSFDEARFMKIERDRLRFTDARSDDNARDYARFFGQLASIHASAGARLRLAVIPDQLQVDDALWEALLAGEPAPERFVRDLPQRRIAAFCAERGLACLDLLAPLREAQRGQPVYHLRDTHWNARGNRVAGLAIAEFLAGSLAQEALASVREQLLDQHALAQAPVADAVAGEPE